MVLETVTFKAQSTSGVAFRKIVVSAVQPDWLSFRAKLATLFPADYDKPIFYYDEEADLVLVDSQEEFEDAVDVAKGRNGVLKVGVGIPDDSNARMSKIQAVLLGSAPPSRSASVIIQEGKAGAEESIASSETTASSTVSSVTSMTSSTSNSDSTATTDLLGMRSLNTTQPVAANTSPVMEEEWQRVERIPDEAGDATPRSSPRSPPRSPPLAPSDVPNPKPELGERAPDLPMEGVEETPAYDTQSPPTYEGGEAAITGLDTSAANEHLHRDQEVTTETTTRASGKERDEATSECEENGQAPQENADTSRASTSSANPPDPENSSMAKMQEQMETLIGTVRRILNEHPELYEQFNAFVNQLMDVVSKNFEHVRTNVKNMWDTYWEQVAAHRQEQERASEQQSPGTGPGWHGCRDGWQRGRMFPGGPGQGPKCGWSKFGGGRCGGRSMMRGNGWGSGWSGRPWAPPKMGRSWAGSATSHQTTDNHATTSSSQVHTTANTTHHRSAQEYPGAYPGAYPVAPPVPPTPVVVDDMDEKVMTLIGMGFDVPRERLRHLLRTHNMDLERVVESLVSGEN